jgi:ketosteroid isomerase-like protein
MKRFLSLAILSFAAALFAFSQSSCAGPQPVTSTNGNMATPVSAPTPDKAAIEVEIKRIENDWPRIIKEHDAETVKKIEADDAVFVYPDGSLGNKGQDVKDLESGTLSADSWEVADLKVNVLSDDVAVVSGRSIVKNGKLKLPDGRTQDISGEYRWVDTYAKRNGQWLQVAGSTTPVKGASSPSPKPSPSPSASPATKASPGAKASPVTAKPSPAMKAPPAMKPAATPARTKTP